MSAVSLGDRWRAHLESGTSHVVGLLRADGRPFVTRGWGMCVDDGTGSGRIVLSTVEVAALGYPGNDFAGAPIAVTATDVRTLRSLQLKGPVIGVAAVTDADRARLAAYCDDFFTAVAETDGIPPVLMARTIPDEVVACRFEITEAFDQTPGPGAGRPLGSDDGS
jgi:hypothetical protein